jgi:hypothetical protein
MTCKEFLEDGLCSSTYNTCDYKMRFSNKQNFKNRTQANTIYYRKIANHSKKKEKICETFGLNLTLKKK